ncbi:DUF2480 family protein [Flagellimonas pelagia]|uniref:DUF2480 family protein n=1 Tax=Flagellimonas pelagia TaxID=2306998 RepID=A0A3A1NGY8_9FLAO|nr:DUF2480 family protein [Allomuricauda maritima]RIV44525.1 DUF2480 family protein [Allomuricauda maritima]TXJ94589.1 DUF2480 family protein [Allomuricauda maritima]
MEKEIINRVAQSQLVTFDLEDYYPKGERKVLDVSEWLYEGIILREKEFRAYVDAHNWSNYQDAYVALHCSSDAIIPGWAFMLVASRLAPYVKRVVVGNLVDLETSLFQTIIENLDVSEFADKPVIIKGCSHKPVPENAYIMAMMKIQEVAKSVMYGEACSSVPLFKKKK